MRMPDKYNKQTNTLHINSAYIREQQKKDTQMNKNLQSSKIKKNKTRDEFYTPEKTAI